MSVHLGEGMARMLIALSGGGVLGFSGCTLLATITRGAPGPILLAAAIFTLPVALLAIALPSKQRVSRPLIAQTLLCLQGLVVGSLALASALSEPHPALIAICSLLFALSAASFYALRGERSRAAA